MDRNLTKVELNILRSARNGDLFRSESGADLYQSYMDGGRVKVTGAVRRITARETRLLEIGERHGFKRHWLLTDDGIAALAKQEAS